METKEETLEILTDLIEINNDRIEGYERAIKELEGGNDDLKTLFTKMIKESHGFKMELGTEVQALGEEMTTDTTTGGKIYRAWMDVKAAFTDHSRKSILEACERGEDAARKAYRTALEDDELPAFLGEIITKQAAILLASHDEIKAFRDIQK
jgi:uncharacterized protein (TIGR02284 family)